MKIGFIGLGNMARAIILGILRAKQVTPAEIIVHSQHKESYEPFAREHGLTAVASNQEVAAASDYLFIAVKPDVVAEVLAEISATIVQKEVVVISMAAGISLAELAKESPKQTAIMRIMPNVNVANNAGVTAFVANEFVKPVQLQQIQELLGQLGTVLEISEADFTTFSALAGSAPAFVYLFIDALARAGVKHGLTKPLATKIAAQTVLGSATNVLASSESPWDLIDQVSSPGGTTVAGLLAMEEAGLMSAVVKGVDATIARDLENQG